MAEEWEEDDDWEAAPAVPQQTSTLSAKSGGAAAVHTATVPDEWDDEDAVPEEEPVVAAAAFRAPAPVKPAKRLAMALKEKESQELEAARQRAIAREKELSEMDETARKLEMQRIVEEADLDNTRDLFGSAEPGASVPAGDNLHTMHPKTDEELLKYASLLTEKCRQFNVDVRRTARYVIFVKEVLRGLTADLGPDDAKDIATHMNTISNRKLDEFKRAKGGVKKKPSKKSAVRVDRDNDVLDSSLHDRFDNDDFM